MIDLNRYSYRLIIFIFSVNLFSATYYIDSIHGNDGYAGTSMGPWEHISYGISEAAASDTLMLSGTFYLGQDSGSTVNGIEITKDLTFIGEGAKNTFVKAASSPGTAATRVFQINTGITAEIRSLSIQNGVAVNGGGIFSRGILTLEYVDVSSNECSDSGGGINTTGILTIKNSCISGNSSVNQGGGILINFSGSKTFQIENCTVSENSVSDKDGFGGGISIQANALNQNITVSALINSCTIADNTSGNEAKGLLAYTSENIGNDATINLNIKNSLFSNGTSGNYAEDTSDGGVVNIDRSYTFCIDATLPTSNQYYNNVDPLLLPLADNGGQTMTHATIWGSPAIEAISIGDGTGDYNGAPLTDQRNIAISRTKKDIGSYEYNGIGTFYVNSLTGDDANGDGSESNPWLNIGKAINANNILENDVIDATGTFYMDQDPYVNQFVANGYVIGEVDRNVIIHGQGADQTVIKACTDGQQAVSRLFLILDGYGLTLRDISLQNGYDDTGAGIQSRGDLTLERVMISNCSTPEFQNGGAIMFKGDLLDISNSTIYSNYSANYGGGIYIAMMNDSCVVNLTNSTFAHNSADNGGGAIYANVYTTSEQDTSSFELNINGCTSGYNEDHSNQGSFIVYHRSGFNCSYDISLQNSIINDIGNNESGVVVIDRDCTVCNDETIGINGQYNQNVTDCLLGELTDNGGGTLTFPLMEGSPAIDAIPITAGSSDYNGAPLLDQRGMPIEGSNKDIGAFEGTIPYYLSAPDITGAWGEGIYWLFWNWVERATNYAVYSSEEPYGIFDLEYLCNSETYEYGKDVPFDRSYFFTVTAIDTTRSKGIPETIEIKKPLR